MSESTSHTSSSTCRPKGPLRVAFCITELEFGGAERCLVELATRLDRRRFSAEVYCLAGPPRGPGPSLVEKLQQAQIPVCFLGRAPRQPKAKHFGQVLQAPRVMWRLRRLLVRQRPDVVQTFLFHANILGRLSARWAGVARVVSGIRVADPRRWRLRLDAWTEWMVDRHVCVSESVAEFSRRVGRLSPGKLIVISNGVDAARFRDAEPLPLADLGIPPGRRMIVCIGRLDIQKGQDWLLETAADWLPQVPEHDLVLLGSGPREPRLRRLAAERNITDRVHFAGWRTDIPCVLKAADLLVLPSRWEGMPNVVLEAMASGTPVVATDVEGVAELLGPAGSTQTAPLGAPEVFAEKVVALVARPDFAAQIGRENLNRVKQGFSIEAMAAAYEALYESLHAT